MHYRVGKESRPNNQVDSLGETAGQGAGAVTHEDGPKPTVFNLKRKTLKEDRMSANF